MTFLERLFNIIEWDLGKGAMHKICSKDEMGEVAHSFNEMQESVSSRKKLNKTEEVLSCLKKLSLNQKH